MTITGFLDRLEGVRRTDSGVMARCPAHDDHDQSLSVGTGDDGRILINCFAGCSPHGIVTAMGLSLRDLFPSQDGATVQPPSGCTLAQYAEAKQLPLAFLQKLGLRDITYDRHPAVRIPYLDQAGTEIAVQFRTALTGANRFKWKKGAKPTLYGQERLSTARKMGSIALVEGPSDCHTLWSHDIAAVGLPSATTWNEQEWASLFDAISIIYVVIEPDQGGRSVLGSLATSSLQDRVRLVTLSEAKDPSALHLADPGAFCDRWRSACALAIPWPEHAHIEAAVRTRELWAQCAVLARQPRILDRFVEDLRRRGVVGEARTAKVVFLGVVSRLLNSPVSIAVKGPSSVGKSFVAEGVLAFVPPSAYYALSAMSERALAYSNEPLAHRMLVLYEAAALQGDFARYLMRSLLSEGRVRYETVEKTGRGLKARLIEREGPTGLIVTTTAVKLHAENETRLISVPITDTPDQTKAVLLELARRRKAAALPPVNLEPWHALQRWLEMMEHRVVIPYAETLAELIPPVAVRLRRDFNAVLTLIEAHAVLHQATRNRTSDGAIIAILEDYAVVRDLVAELVAENVEATVSKTVRTTVVAVERLLGDATPSDGDTDGVTVSSVARALKLDKSAAWRRVQAT